MKTEEKSILLVSSIRATHSHTHKQDAGHRAQRIRKQNSNEAVERRTAKKKRIRRFCGGSRCFSLPFRRYTTPKHHSNDVVDIAARTPQNQRRKTEEEPETEQRTPNEAWPNSYRHKIQSFNFSRISDFQMQRSQSTVSSSFHTTHMNEYGQSGWDAEAGAKKCS